MRVGLGTLLGIDAQPGEIAGWGPVTAPVARSIAARQQRSQWRFAILDDDGRLLFDGITRRRPTPADPDQQADRPGGVDRGAVCGGIVELHVPASLLTDPATAGAHPGWAAVLADLAAHYRQQRPIQQDPAARFPGRPLRRRSQIVFQRCIFPYCRHPASDCDLDHHHEHARGGRTEPANIGPGCRHDHTLKTSRGWHLIRHDQYNYLWISPLGRHHQVSIDPIAAPLPAPLPRQQPAELDPPADEPERPPASFQPRTRRGRPLPSLTAASKPTTGPPETDPDPPPF